ncbi:MULTISPECIES: GntR family transcriptional regulator [unclassified Methylobacterium]|jgi:DNA-binding GntR family transcriptional regulator|uniref:GntR family transcriptional regulator n=1 Tax=unclassified Methylobacterium TaxID=2615210 RepID=UPI0013551F88|nr:GntR family transcriptional regulator [Methylobacterium sp. 2A]MWV20614.1 GntR family transcriptional regulator [Methylobacterium sp. 2A]
MFTAVPGRRVPDRLRHKTVAAAVADSLRRRILTGELRPGVQLRQDALAEEFGISRIPIREALLQLEAVNLVKIAPHRGAVVSGLSLTEVEDIFRLRAQLEPQLLPLSARHLTDEDFRDLRAVLKAYGEALSSGEVMLWGELNRRFHFDLLRHAERPRALAIVSGLLQDCDRPTRLQLQAMGDVARAQEEHTQILDLCEARDVDAAAAVLRAHIEYVGVCLLAVYRDGQARL